MIVYAPGFGAVGWAGIIGVEPGYRPAGSRDEHAHFLDVAWRATVTDLTDAVPAAAIRAVGGYPPRTLAMQMSDAAAARIAALVRSAADAG